MTVNDLTRHIPNMSSSFAHGGSSVFASFRGLNPSLFTNINPVVYMDGVAYADMYDFDPSLADVKQIEILRGPQGTLYGKDAIGAIINIVTNTPKNELEGNVVAEYGSFNTLNTKVNATGAVIEDKLFAGINGSFYKTDGWVKNDYPGMNKNATRKENRKTSGFLL